MNSINFLTQGQGQPLVFLHGIGGGAASWRWQLDEFGRTHCAIAWDAPGYGESEPLPDVTIATFARDLHQFLQEQQIEHPILVGHSLGGMIVQEYLATFPGKTSKVVLYSTSPAFGRRDGEWQQEFVRARLGPLDQGRTMAEIAPEIVQKMVGSAATADGIELATRCMAATSAETYRASVLSLLDFDRRDNLGKIDVPCLCVTGAEDSNAPAPMMEKMAAKIPGAQFKVLPGLGHLSHMENPALFNDCVRTFIGG